MAWTLYSGWDFAKISTSFQLAFTDSAARLVTFTSGTYCHRDLQTVTGSGAYDDFATALQTAMNAASSGYTVTFSTSTFFYTISKASAFTIDATNGSGSTSVTAKNVLGFNSLPTGSATSQVSQIRPYYVISGALGAASDQSGDYEPDGIAAAGEATDGSHYGISRDEAPVFSDYTINFEPDTATFSRKAAASVPWTWQHFFAHNRSDQPFLASDGTDNTVHTLRADGASFRPIRVSPDWDSYFHIPIKTYVDGRL